VLRLHGVAQEDVLVADVDRADVARFALRLLRLVLGGIGDRAAVGPPGELADARS